MSRPIAGFAAAIWLAGYAVNFAAESSLVDAAEKGELEKANALLEMGAEPDQRQVDGMTPLLWAAEKSQCMFAYRLMKAGADVTLANDYGVTPLSLACRNGHPHITGYLLKYGADPNRKLKSGEAPLHLAARTGNPRCVEHLLDHKADVNARDKKGQTPIMWAAAEGNLEAVDLLLKARADFKTPLSSGWTPLFFAVREGRTDVVRRLLKAGAAVDAPARPEKASNKSLRNGTTPLMLAVENAHFELALELVRAGADPNDDLTGLTPLHVVTRVRKTGLGDNEAGNPPPPGSGKVGSLQFVREIVKLGADLDVCIEKGGGRAENGATPFFLGAKSADLPFLKLLEDLGADPSIPNEDKSTPLMVAAGLGTHAPGEEAGTEQECLDTVRYLLELGADINAVDKKGETAMHGAAFKSLPKMVRFLDANGADIKVWNQENKRGWTPLVIAQGFRPGNFKPHQRTIKAISAVMRSHGLEPPPPPPRTKKGWQE